MDPSEAEQQTASSPVSEPRAVDGSTSPAVKGSAALATNAAEVPAVETTVSGSVAPSASADGTRPVDAAPTASSDNSLLEDAPSSGDLAAVGITSATPEKVATALSDGNERAEGVTVEPCADEANATAVVAAVGLTSATPERVATALGDGSERAEKVTAVTAEPCAGVPEA